MNRTLGQPSPRPTGQGPALPRASFARSGTPGSVPRSFRVTRPGDAWESQAEHAAQGHAQDTETQRLPSLSSAMPASPAMRDTLASPGSPLPAPSRAALERSLGHDFSQVRIHADARAGQSARDASARAYTVGEHVVFSPGAYQPGSASGQALLAHELAHVAQHRSLPGEAVMSRVPGPGGAAARPLVQVVNENLPTVIDNSKTLEEITHMFYDVPPEMIGPGELYPAGHFIIMCDDYKYGLTQSSFTISYTLSDSDRRHTERPTALFGSPTQFAECWYSHVRVNMRQRQTIFLPNDLATATSLGGTPCMRAGYTQAQENAETLVHERQHEADNVQAAREVGTEALSAIGSTLGVGTYMAEAEYTSDPAARLQACARNVRRRLNAVRDQLEISYYRRSLQYAVNLDPHDAGEHSDSFRRVQQAILRRAEERDAP